MQYYYEIAEGSVRNRHIICPVEDLGLAVEEARKAKRELYRSYYMYDGDLKKHFAVKKTTKNYHGKYYLRRLIFDIDKGTDTDDFVLRRAREFVKVLQDDWKLHTSGMQMWYSGRGYHIQTPEFFHMPPSNNLPQLWVQTAKLYFPEVDTAPYMRTGLIRVGWTLNNKSQLYKIRLDTDDFFSLSADEIMEKAKSGEIEKIETEWDDKLDHSDKIKRLGEIKVNKEEHPELSNLVTCMQHLWERGSEKGRRHDDIMRLVSAFRRGPLTKSAIMVLMKYWANGMDEKEVEKHVNYVFKQDYRYGCNDRIMIEYCDPQCYYHKYKDLAVEFLSATELEKRYVADIRAGNKKVLDLTKLWNLKTTRKPFVVKPKDSVLIIGDTKLGKTALAQNLCMSFSNHKIDYYTFETADDLLFRRFIQIGMSMTEDEVDKYYGTNPNSLSKCMDHIHIQPVKLNIATMEKLIAERRPEVIVLDTVKATRSGKLGEHVSKEEKIADWMKEVAQKYKMIVIGIHHIPKNKSGKKLTMHSGYGGAGLEQMADIILGIEGGHTTSYRTVSSLGARDNDNFRIKMQFNKQTMRLTKVMEFSK